MVVDLPSSVRPLAEALHSELEQTLGERYVAFFLYGSVCFPPSAVADFDAHVIVREPFDDADRAAIDAVDAKLRSLPLGDDTDIWYVTLDAAAQSDPPQTERRPGFRDGAWSLHRAHIHAGRSLSVHGPDPREIVPVPTWDELDAGLQDALDLEDHLDDARAYSVLQLCRVLYSYAMRDVVVSKLQAGIWSLGAIDVDQHALVRSALDAYERRSYAVEEDVRPFYEMMCGRIAAARAG